MQAVILAAGMGTRMRPLTHNRPKPLVLVGGRPLVEHVLDVLPREVDSLVLVVKYLRHMLQEHLGESYQGLPITYVEQNVPDGTGGALFAARAHLKDRFMVLPADDLHGPLALAKMVQHDAAILATYSDTPERFGALALTAEGTLDIIEEKPLHPKTNFVSTGVMVLDTRIFSYDAPVVNGELRLTDLVGKFAKDVPVRIVTQDAWCSVGCPEDIPAAEYFLGRKTATRPFSYT